MNNFTLSTLTHKVADSIQLRKRQKIVIATILTTLGFIISTQTINIVFQRYYFIVEVTVFAYMMALWALWEKMTIQRAIVVFILPTLFVLAMTGFYFLLPIYWITRLPVVIVFGLAYYSLLLSQNVFNVAASRSIPLYRAASTVSLIFTLITAFFLFNVVFAFKLSFYFNAIVIFIISFALFLQSLWTVELGNVRKGELLYSGVLSLVMAEMAAVLSFLPLEPTIWSLFLSAVLYILLGIVMEFLRERLTNQIVWEYVGVGIIVFLFSILATSWGG